MTNGGSHYPTPPQNLLRLPGQTIIPIQREEVLEEEIDQSLDYDPNTMEAL